MDKLPLGQIGQGQTPSLSGFMFWLWPIIILLASTASLGSLGCPELKLQKNKLICKECYCQYCNILSATVKVLWTSYRSGLVQGDKQSQYSLVSSQHCIVIG